MWYDPRNVMGTVGIGLLLAAIAAALYVHQFLSDWCC